MLHWVFSALQGLFSSCGMGATLPCDAQAFLVVKHWVLWAMDSGVVEHDLSCFSTSGIFLDQGLNLCSLHWQADSYLPHHQGSPGGPFIDARTEHPKDCSPFSDLTVSFPFWKNFQWLQIFTDKFQILRPGSGHRLRGPGSKSLPCAFP